jgi:hypothetical protein
MSSAMNTTFIPMLLTIMLKVSAGFHLDCLGKRSDTWNVIDHEAELMPPRPPRG